jgi:hypothetical protein
MISANDLQMISDFDLSQDFSSDRSREIEMVLANWTLEIRSDRIIKKILPFSRAIWNFVVLRNVMAASDDITFLRATRCHIALEKGPYLINSGCKEHKSTGILVYFQVMHVHLTSIRFQSGVKVSRILTCNNNNYYFFSHNRLHKIGGCMCVLVRKLVLIKVILSPVF